MSTPPSEPAEKGFNLPKAEERILAFWEKHRIFEKSLEKTKNGKPFAFYDGPPVRHGPAALRAHSRLYY